MENRKTTILVTGGAGYIGSHTVQRLRARGDDVVVLDNLGTGFRNAVRGRGAGRRRRRRRALLDRLFTERRIETVVHFAAHTIVPESVSDPLKYYGNNTCQTRGLLAACQRHGVKHFVFSSTAAVYGLPKDGVADEDAVLAPINPYGTSKLMSEWMLRDLAVATPLRYVVLRYFNVAGSDPQGRIGQSTRKATLLVKVACEASVGKRPHVSIYGTDYPTPDGTGVRDYIHVDDLARAHLDALDYLRDGGAPAVLNCGYGHGYSVREVFESVAARRRSPPEHPRGTAPRRGPARADRPRRPDPAGARLEARARRPGRDRPQLAALGGKAAPRALVVRHGLSWGMVFARPRSLSGRLLLGLAAISLPLLVALLLAGVQMRRMAETSERLVGEGVQATRVTQELFAQIASLERTVRLYQVITDAKLIDAYRTQERRLAELEAQLLQQLRSTLARESVEQLRATRQQIDAELLGGRGPPEQFDGIFGRFDDLNRHATRASELANAQIDGELGLLREQTLRAQRQLFWISALLVPLTIGAILFFSLGLGRPLRQIDRAIDDLGRGAFFSPIRVTGPVDLERLGRQLEWLRQRLVDLAQERNRFLRHMSHELKTPLANIREGTELLMDGAVGELATPQREVTGILRDNGIRLQRMIENLLSFSAWQSNSLGLENSEFRVRPLIKQVIENQQLALLSQRLRLDVRIEDLTLHADRGKIRLILENLLSNAIKYSPRAGTIFIHAATVGDQFQLDVADSGPGIPVEERKNVFDAFYTGKAPGGHVRGTGIGLSVVLEFVMAHGGQVDIVDGEFPGAHFRILMPLRCAAAGPETAGAPEGQADAA
jgi:two-component system, NtrC family, sensor histidine kinase GlrK